MLINRHISLSSFEIEQFNDILGEFDDLLGPDIPEEYQKDRINEKLIKDYECWPPGILKERKTAEWQKKWKETLNRIRKN